MTLFCVQKRKKPAPLIGINSQPSLFWLPVGVASLGGYTKRAPLLVVGGAHAALGFDLYSFMISTKASNWIVAPAGGGQNSPSQGGETLFSQIRVRPTVWLA